MVELEFNEYNSYVTNHDELVEAWLTYDGVHGLPREEVERWGLEAEVVADRVNATLPVIRDDYDNEDALQRLEQRRRPYLERMDLDTEESQP